MFKNGGKATSNLLNLSTEQLEGELLVPEFFQLHCTGGSGTAHLEGGATLEAAARASVTGCTVVGFAKCEVHSPGAPVGTISAEGEGLGKLGGVANSVEVLMAAETGSPFTLIDIENELCPFNETEAEVTGGATLLLLEALTNLKDHLAHLNDDKLFLGEYDMFMDGAGGADTALAHVTEGSRWYLGYPSRRIAESGASGGERRKGV